MIGHIPAAEDEIDKPITKIFKKVKYGPEFRIDCGAFSNNGKYFATGSIDGIIEIHDPETCELDKNLVYQNQENYMLHKDPVVSLCFSKDDELLATGDEKGLIKVWRIQTGKLLKKIEGVFQTSISSLIFGNEFSHLISASKDVRVIGLKSGKALKEYRGHTAYVNCILINEDSTRLVTGS